MPRCWRSKRPNSRLGTWVSSRTVARGEIRGGAPAMPASSKRPLVMGGSLVTAAAERGGGELVPVDSEHSAILQCIAGRPSGEVRRLVITASGGPFRTWPREQLERATIADA